MQDRLPDNDLIYMCDAAQLPGRGFGVTEVRYYGPSQALPNNSEYETASFSFICRQTARERFFFDEWMNVINPVSNFHFEYANNYWSDIVIYQLGEFSSKDPTPLGFGGLSINNPTWSPQPGRGPLTRNDEESLRMREAARGGTAALDQSRATAPDIIYGWTLRRAWPILVSPQQVTWQDQDILRLQVTFTYKNWDRENFMR